MSSTTRRRVLAALAAAGVGGVATQRDLVGVAAPFSGRAFDGFGATGPDTVENPYGPATVSYDDYGVPHVEADDERALYFAAGYTQARDRLFGMDLVRRQMRGELSAVFGERTVESDRFHRKMDFTAAAAATWEGLRGTAVEAPVRALARGINRYLDLAPALPLEFRLLGYEPDEWTPVDTALVAKAIAWGLTGTFWDLERAVIEESLGEAALDLYPDAYEHDYPIVRPGVHDWPAEEGGDGTEAYTDGRESPSIPRELVDWLREVAGGPSGATGSNNWIVSGEHTETGGPLLANDPHLTLQVPPVWYEMHLRGPGMDVRGAAFPGAPLIVIGQNRGVAWGITNVGGDVLDCYTYDTRAGGREYRYDGEWRPVQSRTETIDVSGGENREVSIEKTVHGPLIEREGRRVGVAWVGLAATREPLAVYRYNRASGIDEFREGLRVFDIPGQNTVYIDREGRTMYYPAAKYPIREVDGEDVPGNRIFDGSAGEGEWRGFTPYGESTWEGFVDFGEIPHLIDPGYVATANQRVVDGYEHYLGDAEYMGDPYRATRIYERLDGAVDAGEIDTAFMKDLQNDRHSVHADVWVPQVVAARGKTSGQAREYVDLLAEWDRGMRADSEAALVYSVWAEAFRDAVLRDEFAAADLDSEYYPGEDWPIQQLDPDSRWFDDADTGGTERRADAVARAMETTVERIETEGWETYGDRHRLAIEHPFPLEFLDYPDRPAGGSANTVFNLGADGATGSSWRMIASFDGPSYSVIPGGNSGRYVSEHYDDQLDMWLDGEYKEMSFEIPEGTDIEFVAGEDAGGSS